MQRRSLLRLGLAYGAMVGAAFGATFWATGGPTRAQTSPGEVTLGPVTRQPLPRYVSLRKRANIRRGPGREHRIDWVFLHPGTPLRVVAEFDVWRKVVDADGAGGWINKFFLLGDRTVIVRAAQTGLRAAPRESARLVAKLEEGVIARLEGCEAGWCAVTSDGYDGWVERATVWGVDPSE